MNQTAQSQNQRVPIKTPPIERANALIGAALHLSLRGSVLLFVRLVWFALIFVTLSLFVLTIPARYSQLLILGAENSIALKELGLAPIAIAWLIGPLDGLVFLTYTLVGALIFSRKSQEWIGLFASLTLITAVFAVVRPSDSLLFVDQGLRIPLLLILAIATVTITVFVYIFPDGHFVPGWTRWIAFGLCAFAFYGLADRIFITQPFRWPPAPLSPVIFLGILGGAIVQYYRYRRVSDPTQKQQMKWVMLGVAAGAVGLIGFLIIVPLLEPRVAHEGMPRVMYVLIGLPLFYIAVLQLPIALAFSILRYRLWDINFIVSRTLIYLILTGILAGLFATLEKITQDLFVAVTGVQSSFAPIISTLLVVAAFTPLKEAIQKFVEHRVQNASDPTARLRIFGDRVETRISPLHPPQILRRLGAEAVSAYNAKGGAVYLLQDDKPKLAHTLGEWDGVACLEIPIESSPGATRFGSIALDERKNAAQYTDRDRAALNALAQTIARALEEDQFAEAK